METEAATGTAEEKSVEQKFGKTFRIPIDFEMLSDMSQFSQYNLKDKLQIDITFNSPEAMILAGTGADLTKGTDYTYSVKDLRFSSSSTIIRQLRLASFSRVSTRSFLISGGVMTTRFMGTDLN